MFALFNPFYGEISRKSWWAYQSVIWVIFGLLATLFYLPLAALKVAGGPAEGIASIFGTIAAILLAVIAIYMNFCTCVNRLRHIGRSGWWWLVFQVPLIGTPLMLYFCGIVKGEPIQRTMNVRSDIDALKARYERQVEEASEPEFRFEKAIPAAPSPHDYGKRNMRQTGRRPVSIGGGQPRTSFGRRGAV